MPLVELPSVSITGTGLFTPPESVSNAELVASLTEAVLKWNAEHAEEISAGEAVERALPDEEFIVKASGIERRHVMEKSGVLDPARMRPRLDTRGEDGNGDGFIDRRDVETIVARIGWPVYRYGLERQHAALVMSTAPDPILDAIEHDGVNAVSRHLGDVLGDLYPDVARAAGLPETPPSKTAAGASGSKMPRSACEKPCSSPSISSG